MEFTRTYNELKGMFSLSNGNTCLKDHSGIFKPVPFESSSNPIPFNRTGIYNGVNGNIYAAEDRAIAENVKFNYPVYIPNTASTYGKAIILLHGLNERSWHKYLPWAKYLGDKTSRPVILFPLAFHMNRSPESWANPRQMMSLLNKRKSLDGLQMATFANIALSQRLSDDPLRFFTSGKQSADDIVKLLGDIKEGAIPFLKKDAQVDFFSYSIGAFLAQILFLANPNDLLSTSRLFVFCGGTLFDQMRGTSRLIMDSHAYSSLRRYYLHDFPIELKFRSPFSSYVRGGVLGESFMAMIAEESNQAFREHRFQQLRNRLRVVALRKDLVMPAAAVKRALTCIRGDSVFTELDFPFDYTHENPFPIYRNDKSADVDKAFESVFSMATEFLS
jgi:pimeloyl-ACP methyl ester carboxylesterase